MPIAHNGAPMAMQMSPEPPSGPPTTAAINHPHSPADADAATVTRPASTATRPREVTVIPAMYIPLPPTIFRL